MNTTIQYGHPPDDDREAGPHDRQPLQQDIPPPQRAGERRARSAGSTLGFLLKHSTAGAVMAVGRKIADHLLDHEL